MKKGTRTIALVFLYLECRVCNIDGLESVSELWGHILSSPIVGRGLKGFFPRRLWYDCLIESVLS